MKILILAQLVVRSGVGVYIKSLAEQLCRGGDEVHILSAKFELDINDKIVKHRFCRLSYSNILHNYKIFKKIVKENKIDVVYIQHRIVGIYPKIYNFFKERVPCVYVLHTEKLGNNSIISRLCTYKGNLNIAISTRVKEYLISELKIPQEKIRLIYNGVDERNLKPLDLAERNEKRAKLGIAKDKLVICLHGRIDYVKGHDLLIAAIGRLSESQRNRIHVLISGEIKNNPYYDQLQKSINELQIEDKVSFIGWCSPQNILGISDLMVQPSRREGFLLSAVEAFFMKVPVIRSLTGGAEDMQKCCRFVAINDIEQLTNEIARFIDAYDTSEINEYKEMSDRAYVFAEDNCTVSTMTKRVRGVFLEILNENKKS